MYSFIRKFLFPIYLIIILLDLNEYAARFTGSEAILTNFILLLSVIMLFLSRPVHKISNPVNKKFWLALIVFLFFGSLASIAYKGFESIYEELRYYLPTTIIYIVTYRVVISQRSKTEFTSIMNIIALLIGINGIFILISVFFNYDFHSADPSEISRAVGLYSNANRAGYVSAFGQAFAIYLLLSEHNRNRTIYILLYFVTLFATISTFSKGAILVSLLILLRFILFMNRKKINNLYRYRRYSKALLFFIIIGITIVVFQFTRLQSSLSLAQSMRVNHIGMLLSGNINEETTSHRTVLVSYAWEKIQQNVTFGYGLGTFNRMDIGYGTHNIYLKIWGEAGLFGIIFYLIFLAAWLVYSLKSSDVISRMLQLNILIIFSFSGFAAHTLLVNKPYIVILATVIGGSTIYTNINIKKSLKNKYLLLKSNSYDSIFSRR